MRLAGLLALSVATTAPAFAQPRAAAKGQVPIVIETALGTIEAMLDSAHAPMSVTNFLRYVDANLPESGADEFFICIGDQPELDFGGRRNPDGQGFAAFGRVTKGMDVVRRIQRSHADGQRLDPPVTITRITRKR